MSGGEIRYQLWGNPVSVGEIRCQLGKSGVSWGNPVSVGEIRCGEIRCGEIRCQLGKSGGEILWQFMGKSGVRGNPGPIEGAGWGPETSSLSPS